MITALAGRRIDEENADYKRFPLTSISAVREKLRGFFVDNKVTHLVSSGACGADLLAQDVAHELGIDRTIVLPFNVQIFRSSSVTDRPGEWGKIYDRLIKDTQSNRLIILGYNQGNNKAYAETNLEILSMAEKLSQRADRTDVISVIVWEGKPKSEDDMTHGFEKEAIKRKLSTAEISTIS